MRRALAGVFLLVALGAAPARGVTIDSIVVTVADEAITLSRVRFMQAFLRVTGGEGLGRPMATGELSEQEVLDVLIEDAIVYALASRLPMMEATEDDVRQQMSWFAGRFVSEGHRVDFVRRWGFDEEEQRRFFARRATIARFIALKIGLFDDVPERELRSWFEGRAAAYGPDFAAVRARVADDYARESQARAWVEWMEPYRRNHSEMVRVPGGSPSGAPSSTGSGEDDGPAGEAAP